MNICAPVFVALAFLATLSTPTPTDAPTAIDVHSDVVYGEVGGYQLKLNLAIPADASSRRPVVVVIHGGGWRAGDRSHHDDLIRHFAAQGYVAATVGYRFCPQHWFPAQVEDVKCAIRYLRAHADKYNIDADRIGAVGFSAGAHLAMMLGVMDAQDGLNDSGGNDGVDSKVQAVVAFFGPTDFELPLTEETQQLVRDFLGGSIEESRAVYKRASPVTYVSKGDAPSLLFQGTNDPLVPHAHAVRMADAMQAAGVPGRVELLIGAGHGWGGDELAHTAAAMTTFFDQHLKTDVKE